MEQPKVELISIFDGSVKVLYNNRHVGYMDRKPNHVNGNFVGDLEQQLAVILHKVESDALTQLHK